MACFTCGLAFDGDVNALLRKYKDQYEEKGVERYFYRLRPGGELLICRKESFKIIFENLIKPNLQKGAEYAHIQEFNAK